MKTLNAGKHVYCEWPLGRDVRESEEIRDAAANAGVHVAVGLQARVNPTLLKAQAMLSDGALGRILSARMYSGTIAFGPAENEADSYLEDPNNGATHLTIHGGHAIDALIALIGPIEALDTLGNTQYKDISISDESRMLKRTIPDHLLFQAKAKKNSIGIGVEVDGGKQPLDARFRFSITGELGTMTLEGAALVGFQAGRLALTLNGTPVPINEHEIAGLPDAAANVASMYIALRDDIAF